MSCTVSELPSGCRLRGMASSAAAAAAAAQSGSGATSVGGIGVNNSSGSGNNGAASNAQVAASGMHVGGLRLGSATAQSTATAASGTGAGTTTTAATAASALPPDAVSSSSPLQRQQQSQKPCCFCWCCCCSCSWAKCLAIKNAEDNAPTKRDLASTDLLLDGEEPTLEEIRSWGKSFDKLMKSAAGRKVFRDFLRSEFSEENILFWLACEELKSETCQEVVEEKARLIYEDYISILSPREVSLDSRVREIVNRNMVEPTPHTFDEAQIQIYTLMHRDSYPRFLNSPKFKTLAQLQDGPSAAGSTAESPT